MKPVLKGLTFLAGAFISTSLICHAQDSAAPASTAMPSTTAVSKQRPAPLLTWQQRLDKMQAKYPQYTDLIFKLRTKRTELETKESQIKPAMEARRAKAEQERMSRLEEFKKVDPDRYNEIMAQETARKQKEPPAAQLTADQIKNAPAPAKLMEEVTKLRGEVGDLEKQLRTKIKSAKAN